MYFHELETIHVLYEKPILVEGSNLQKWYQRVASEPELATLKRGGYLHAQGVAGKMGVKSMAVLMDAMVMLSALKNGLDAGQRSCGTCDPGMLNLSQTAKIQRS